MAKLKRYKYHIFLDSSSLYGAPITKELKLFVDKYKNDDKISLYIYIPEVVEKELERRILEDYKAKHNQVVKHLRSLRKLFPDMANDFPEELSEQEIISAKNTLVKDLGIEVVPTPIDKIDWKEVIERATKYTVPFEEAHEKGFKDMIIAETAINHFLGSSHASSHCFVTSDELQTEYIRERTKTHRRFSTFQSIPDLETNIKLRLDESTRKIVDVLIKEASQAFYIDEDKKTFFNRAGLEKKLNNEVTKLLNSKEFKERYVTFRVLNNASMRGVKVAKPIFINRPGKSDFHWRSVILGDVPLEIETTNGNKRFVNLDVEFSVDWSASFTKKGQIRPKDMKIIKIELSSYDVDYLLPSHSTTGVKTLTSIGQPVFPAQTFKAIADFQNSFQTNSQFLESIKGSLDQSKRISDIFKSWYGDPDTDGKREQ